MEIRSYQTLDELLRRRWHCSSTFQPVPNAEEFVQARVQAQNQQSRKGKTNEKLSNEGSVKCVQIPRQEVSNE
jgi:hypothetical protein